MKRTKKAIQTADSFQNFETRTGINAGSQQDGSTYGFNPITRNRQELEWAYRGSWIVKAVVDSFAEDMTREGVELSGEIPPDEIELLHREATRLQIWHGLCLAIKWARLFGGSLAMLLIEGQNPETPLNLDSIGKKQFKGLMVFDRWMVWPEMSDLITELGPDLGRPKYYRVISDTMSMPSMRIHHSRVVRMEGVDLPYWQRLSENGWGTSVIESLWDRLIPFDSVTQGAAQLAYKAHLRTYSVEGLREIIAMGGTAMEALAKQIDLMRKYQNNEGLSLIDKQDEFATHSYTFSGLSDLILQMGQQLSGASGIPLVRLFGQSPAGLNSTGESDIRNYYDNISQQQEARLLTGVHLIYSVLYRSTFGKEPPDSFGIDFRPLWQLSAKEKGELAETITRSVVSASDAGLIDRHTALKELRQSSRETGVWSNITDDDIEAAENEPPPLLNGEPQPQDAQTPNETQPV